MGAIFGEIVELLRPDSDEDSDESTVPFGKPVGRKVQKTVVLKDITKRLSFYNPELAAEQQKQTHGSQGGEGAENMNKQKSREAASEYREGDQDTATWGEVKESIVQDLREWFPWLSSKPSPEEKPATPEARQSAAAAPPLGPQAAPGQGDEFQASWKSIGHVVERLEFPSVESASTVCPSSRDNVTNSCNEVTDEFAEDFDPICNKQFNTENQTEAAQQFATSTSDGTEQDNEDTRLFLSQGFKGAAAAAAATVEVTDNDKPRLLSSTSFPERVRSSISSQLTPVVSIDFDSTHVVQITAPTSDPQQLKSPPKVANHERRRASHQPASASLSIEDKGFKQLFGPFTSKGNSTQSPEQKQQPAPAKKSFWPITVAAADLFSGVKSALDLAKHKQQQPVTATPTSAERRRTVMVDQQSQRDSLKPILDQPRSVSLDLVAAQGGARGASDSRGASPQQSMSKESSLISHSSVSFDSQQSSGNSQLLQPTPAGGRGRRPSQLRSQYCDININQVTSAAPKRRSLPTAPPPALLKSALDPAQYVAAHAIEHIQELKLVNPKAAHEIEKAFDEEKLEGILEKKAPFGLFFKPRRVVLHQFELKDFAPQHDPKARPKSLDFYNKACTVREASTEEFQLKVDGDRGMHVFKITPHNPYTVEEWVCSITKVLEAAKMLRELRERQKITSIMQQQPLR